jgi:hypothetical protein
MFWLFTLLLETSVLPQSPEAWQLMVDEGVVLSELVYDKTPQGLSCKKNSQYEVIQALENEANLRQQNPAYLAEAMVVYLWDDWTLLYVTGYDIREVLENLSDKTSLEVFLEQAYFEHHVCLLGVLKVLTEGYQGNYQVSPEGYRHVLDKSGQPYQPLALEPAYFPGTGIFEPLGLVYAVRLGDFLRIGWLRQQAIGMIAETLERRATESSDPLKVRRE